MVDGSVSNLSTHRLFAIKKAPPSAVWGGWWCGCRLGNQRLAFAELPFLAVFAAGSAGFGREGLATDRRGLGEVAALCGRRDDLERHDGERDAHRSFVTLGVDGVAQTGLVVAGRIECLLILGVHPGFFAGSCALHEGRAPTRDGLEDLLRLHVLHVDAGAAREGEKRSEEGCGSERANIHGQSPWVVGPFFILPYNEKKASIC